MARRRRPSAVVEVEEVAAALSLAGASSWCFVVVVCCGMWGRLLRWVFWVAAAGVLGRRRTCWIRGVRTSIAVEVLCGFEVVGGRRWKNVGYSRGSSDDIGRVCWNAHFRLHSRVIGAHEVQRDD